jgi:hypothetical protein
VVRSDVLPNLETVLVSGLKCHPDQDRVFPSSSNQRASSHQSKSAVPPTGYNPSNLTSY